MSRILAFFCLLSFLILFFSFSGCNIFSSGGGGGNAEDHIAKGRKYINDSEYAKALAEFEKAVNADPLSSDALYYYAKAYQLAEGVSIATLLKEVAKGQGAQGGVPVYERTGNGPSYDYSEKTAMYRSAIVVVRCLNPIVQGLTHGDIVADDVRFDLSVGTSLRAVLNLRDSNGDEVIDNRDVYLSTSAGGAGGGFNLGGTGTTSFKTLADSLGSNPDSVNQFINQVGDFLETAGDLVSDFLKQSGADTTNAQDVQKFIDDIKKSINMYYVAPATCPASVNTSDAQSMAACDNDGDGRYNEELINGIDDDADGLIDEDAVLPTAAALRNVKCPSCP
ncbi:MAG: hypothetical protein QME66_10585 [Candidatus Eisenbacteria bacterium]|nr:hypothetical protein [Candidatus Eisenbacteria bacterium]